MASALHFPHRFYKLSRMRESYRVWSDVCPYSLRLSVQSTLPTRKYPNQSSIYDIFFFTQRVVRASLEMVSSKFSRLTTLLQLKFYLRKSLYCHEIQKALARTNTLYFKSIYNE